MFPYPGVRIPLRSELSDTGVLKDEISKLASI